MDPGGGADLVDTDDVAMDNFSGADLGDGSDNVSGADLGSGSEALRAFSHNDALSFSALPP